MLTDQDYERLSAYVDGELSQAEHTALETRLATDADLRAELEALRATIGLLAALPARKAPRNFTLDARTARRPAPRVLFLPPAVFSALSAAAATVLIALSALLYGGAQVAPMASSVAFAPTQAASLQREAEAQPLSTQALTATPLSTEKQSMTASPALSEENAIMDTASSASSEGTIDNLPSAAAPGQEAQSTMVMQFAAPDDNAGAADAAASGMSAAAPLQQAAATATALPTQPPPTPSPTPLPTQPAPTDAPSPAPAAQPDNNLPALLLLIVGLGLLAASIIVGVRMGTRWR